MVERYGGHCWALLTGALSSASIRAIPLNLRRGNKVQVSATGVITTGRTRITPDGLPRTDPTAPLPSAKEGELIGAVGDDSRAPIMELGSSREFTADRDGRLYLTANRGSFSDT